MTNSIIEIPEARVQLLEWQVTLHLCMYDSMYCTSVEKQLHGLPSHKSLCERQSFSCGTLINKQTKYTPLGHWDRWMKKVIVDFADLKSLVNSVYFPTGWFEEALAFSSHMRILEEGSDELIPLCTFFFFFKWRSVLAYQFQFLS